MDLKLDGRNVGFKTPIPTRGFGNEFERAAFEGRAWYIDAVTADIDATDTHLACRNDSLTHLFVVKYLWVHCDTQTNIQMHVPTAHYTSAGTAIVPHNVNQAYEGMAVAPLTCHGDETGNTQGRILAAWRIMADGIFILDPGGPIAILGNDQALCFDIVTEPGEVETQLIGYFVPVSFFAGLSYGMNAA